MISFFYSLLFFLERQPKNVFVRAARRGAVFMARLLIQVLYCTTPSTRVLQPANNARDIIVSLTTYHKRMKDIWITIESIMRQTVLPNKVIVWVAKDDVKTLESLPHLLERYIARGVEICACEKDLRSYKKYYYCMQEYPQNVVITMDDDIIYHPDLIKILLDEHSIHPDFVICMRAHEAVYQQGKIQPYNQWKKCIEGPADSVNRAVFFTSGGGTLFPPGALPSEAFSIKMFQLLAPTGDDIWLNYMVRLNGKRILKAKGSPTDVITVSRVTDGLMAQNVFESKNDEQIMNIEQQYGLTLLEHDTLSDSESRIDSNTKINGSL